MKKCIKDYRRHGSTYLAGNEYDVDGTLVEEHETYFGEKLWATSKSQEKREEVQKEETAKEETAEPTPKKTTKKSKK